MSGLAIVTKQCWRNISTDAMVECSPEWLGIRKSLRIEKRDLASRNTV